MIGFKRSQRIVLLVLVGFLGLFWLGWLGVAQLQFLANHESKSPAEGTKEAFGEIHPRQSDQELKDLSFLELEIADSYEEREQGLMYREELCANCGMLFIFEESGIKSFWMKNTLIPLDIIFISPQGEVINIETALPINESQQSLPRYISGRPAQYVLEVNQGWSKKNELQAGDWIDMSSILP